MEELEDVTNTFSVDKESRQLISNLMNEDSFRIPAHISLQEVKLSLYQLIELEKGYEISFDLEKNELVDLFISGELIAKARIYMDDEKIKIRIEETFLKNISENSDNSKDELN